MFWVGGSGGSVVSGSVDSRNVKLHTYGRYICVKIFENWVIMNLSQLHFI